MKVQKYWVLSLNNFRSRVNTDGFFCGITGLYDLGYIICVLLSMVKDKNYLRHDLMGSKYRDSILYCLTLMLQWLDVRIKGIHIFFRGARSNPVYTFPEGIKFINLT